MKKEKISATLYTIRAWLAQLSQPAHQPREQFHESSEVKILGHTNSIAVQATTDGDLTKKVQSALLRTDPSFGA